MLGAEPVELIETARDLACNLHVRDLIFADGNVGSLIHQDVSRLQDGIPEESVGVEVLFLEILLLVLVGRDALKPAERGHHGEQQMKLGVLRNVRLDEDGRLLGIEASGEPVKGHLKNVVLDPRGVSVIGREGVPVGDKEEAIVFFLEPNPVLQCTNIVADVQLACRSHAAQYASVHSLLYFWRHPFLSREPFGKVAGLNGQS